MKRRIKVMNLLILIFGLFVFIIFILFICGRVKKDFKVTLDVKTIEINEEFKNEFKATYKGIDVTNNVKVLNELNTKILGEQIVEYVYEKSGKTYSVSKKIKVVDTIDPVITLKGGNDIIVITGEEFKEPGYVALDNGDGDITDKVSIEGIIDTSKEGEYKIKYSVSDKSGNKTEVSRKITVTSNSPLAMDIKSFTLDGLFENVTLKETEDGGDDYINNIIFAGDSMAQYYVINGQIPKNNLWYQVSITPETAINSPVYIGDVNTEKTFAQNLKIYKPKMLIMTLGTNSVSYMSAEYFYEKYYNFIKELIEASPNTKIIIQSISPVDKRFDEMNSSINNDKINKLNYYIGKMCEELGVKFLNSAPSLKYENGACKEGYCLESDGIHMTKLGQEVLIEFARTHMNK